MRKLATILALATAGALAAAAPAAAAPAWKLDIHHNETHFPPGGTAEYWFDVENIGDEDTSGTVTLSINLPSGVTLDAADGDLGFQAVFGTPWECSGSPGASSLKCTTPGPVRRHSLNRNLLVRVDIAGFASGVRFATAKVEGGGAPSPATALEPTEINPAPAEFGILAESFLADFLKADTVTPERASGAHPDLAVFAFDFNSVAEPTGKSPDQKAEAESVRNIRVDLPPGFLGDPTAVGECTPAELSFSECPRESQVGRADLAVYPIGGEPFRPLSVGVFNMVHPRGSVADLAFTFTGIPVHIRASLDPANRYAVRTVVSDINEALPPFHQKLTLWGVPADPSHDSEHCFPAGEEIDTSSSCAPEAPREAFLTQPFRCDADSFMRLHHYDSWQDTGDFGPDLVYELPGRFEECDKPKFEPEISLEPTGGRAGEPTGLDVSVHVPQNDDPDQPGTPPVEQTTVTLPEGMTVNPAFANGLKGCSEDEIGLETDDRVRCPDASRIGEVELETPLLPGPVEGSMYLAESLDNPFDSLIAFYIAMHDTEERGVLVKVPGHVELDRKTGQITTTFEDLPQVPFEDLTLKFRSGDRAPLVNPPTCGTHEIEATMASYAQPNNDVDLTNTYELDDGPTGASCVSRLSKRPFEPGLISGTLNPLAGAFSPLSARVMRNDSDQELATVEATAPPGFSASLVGIPKCAEAQIAAAERRDDPGDGEREKSRPSCPAASQVGRVITGAGAGPSPIYVNGKVYLAGPYKGAPLSGVAIVPAVAGPVDLGTVVVRAPAYVNPVTAQVSIKSDELPQVVNGVRVRVRDVRIHLDRPGFTLNPTSCEPKAIAATLHSSEGKSKALANRFQVGGCAALPFEPKLGIRLKGGTKRGGHPALKATYVPKPGANLKRLALTFPNSEFVENAHFKTICTRVQYAAKACPAGSIYGHVKAWTPLLETPLEGPVYLRSSDNLLPDAVFALNGEISAEAAVRIDSVKGRLRATVQDAPDVPVSKVVVQMQGGDKGLFVNSRNICKGANRTRANAKAQNGAREILRPKLRPAGCKKARKGKGAKRGKGKGKTKRRAVRR